MTPIKLLAHIGVAMMVVLIPLFVLFALTQCDGQPPHCPPPIGCKR